MENKGYIIITGANGGMGASLTESLIKLGYRVLMACRNIEKGEEIKERLVSLYGGADIKLYTLDLASFDSIKYFTERLYEDKIRIAALINNAGVMNRDFLLTADGFEQNLGVNYIGTYLLTRRVIPLLEEKGHIINTGSLTYRIGKVSSKMFIPDKKHYTRFGIYGISKQAVILFTLELAERLKGEKIIVNAVDPGVVDTGIITMHRWFDPIVDWIFRPIIRTPAQGVERTLLLLTGKVDCNQSGIYWGRYRPVMISPKVLNNPYRWRLWNDTEKIVSKWL